MPSLPDPNDPQVQRDIAESVKWSISGAIPMTQQDAFTRAQGYYSGLQSEPDAAILSAIEQELRRQGQQVDFLANSLSATDIPATQTTSALPAANLPPTVGRQPSSSNERQVREGAYALGNAAYKSGNNAKAAHFYRISAELGHPTAQFNVGLMYEQGIGVPQNDQMAAGWYRLAADPGERDAQS